MARDKKLGLEQKITEIDNDIKQLKTLIEGTIVGEMVKNTKDLEYHIRRSNMLEDHIKILEESFQINQQLITSQTKTLSEALTRLQAEVSETAKLHDKTAKKAVPLLTFGITCAMIVLEVIKHFFK